MIFSGGSVFADNVKVAAIYTLPVEQQWISRIHKALNSAKESGGVEYVYSENVSNTDYERVMREYAEQGVHLIVGEVFGLERRGAIDIDNYADLVIFNPDTVIDKASYASPKLHADGIESVFINGELVWVNDEPTEKRPGMFLPGKKFN